MGNETYSELLADYVHIMDNHQYDIEHVLKNLKLATELISESILKIA